MALYKSSIEYKYLGKEWRKGKIINSKTYKSLPNTLQALYVKINDK